MNQKREADRQMIAFLRLEGLVILGSVIWLYSNLSYSWWWFTVGLMIPDISMVGYLANNRVGAFIYNLGHSLVFPLFAAVLGYAGDNTTVLAAGLIWLAHIGMDRALGYGLKKQSGFKHTHLGEINPQL